jgi:hypothetical protein
VEPDRKGPIETIEISFFGKFIGHTFTGLRLWASKKPVPRALLPWVRFKGVWLTYLHGL